MYTEDRVKKLVLEGSLDEFLDALDFAPESVIDMIKDYCVRFEVNDVRKREAVKAKTGLDVTKAIQWEKETVKEDTEETPKRRVAVAAEEPAKKTSTPGRRVVK